MSIAILRPNQYRHTNPFLPFVDSDNVKGGLRSKVADLTELYELFNADPNISTVPKLKERATLVYVETEEKYYELIDIENVGNASGWQPFLSDVVDGDVLYNHVYMWTGTTASPASPLLLDEWYDNTQSAGRLTGGEITVASESSGQVNVAAGTGIIKLAGTGEQFGGDLNNNDRNAINKRVSWDAKSSLQLEAGYNYIYFDASSNEIVATTNEANIQNNNNFNLGRVFWDDISGFEKITIRLCGQNLWNLNRRLHRVGDELFGVQRASGLVTTDAGGRQIIVTGGVLWAELINRFETTTKTAGQNFIEWFNVGSEWNNNPINTLDNTQFDDDGDLVALTPNYYTIRWVYVVHDSSVHVVYHNEQYSGITEARLATQLAVLPPLVAGYATLSARVIVQEGENEIVEIGSAFEQVFPETIPAQHNDLGGIDGAGTFHLSSAQILDVEDIPNIREVTDVALTGATNGLNNDDNFRVAELGGELTKPTTIEIVSGTSLFIKDDRNETRGIKYDDDYSTYFDERSLVDKGYVDAIASGLIPVASVDVATTGQTTLSGLQEVDGITLTGGERVLVKNQSTASENGIYIADSGAWQRAEDYDGDPESEVRQGQIIPVLDGDTQANQLWVLITPDPIDVGVTPLVFVRFSKPLDILAGNGISISQAGTQKTIGINLANESGLVVDINGLTVDENIAGTGLNWDAGVINIDTTELGVLDAANGLSISGGTQTVVLGGTLSTDTTIQGNDNSFSILNSSGITLSTSFNVFDGAALGLGSHFTLEVEDGSGFRLQGMNNNSCPTYIQYDGSLIPSIEVFVGVWDGTEFVSDGAMKYANNYHSSYVDRSLVDKEYVDNEITGITSSMITGATNGLNVDGQDVKLGGDFTEPINISGNTNFGITAPIFFIESEAIAINGSSSDGIHGFRFPIGGAFDEFGIEVSVGSGGTGLFYIQDYSANYHVRSLPDVGYVTGLTDNLQEQIDQIDIGLTGSTNGLTDANGVVSLGGTLDDNTLIDANNNQFNVTGFSSMLLAATNPDVSFNMDTQGFVFNGNDTAKVDFSLNTNFRIDLGSPMYFEMDGLNGTFVLESTSENQLVFNADGLTVDTAVDNELTFDSNGLTVSTAAPDNVFTFGFDGLKVTTPNENATFDFNDNLLSVTGVSVVSLDGILTLNDVPTEITSEPFSVLVRDDVNGQVKTVDGSELGEDNNNYTTIIVNESTGLTENMYVVLVDTSAAAITLTLPASPVAGQAYKIKDATGDAITNIITINGNSNNIDNAGEALINTDFGAIEIVFDGDLNQWFVLSFVN